MEAKNWESTIIPGHYSPEEFTRLQLQAKTAFKTGYLEGHNKGWNDGAKAGEDKGKQEGFDKVVAWVEKHGGSLDGFREEWQAFLKERGK